MGFRSILLLTMFMSVPGHAAVPTMRKAIVNKILDWVTSRSQATVRFSSISGSKKEGILLRDLTITTPSVILSVPETKLTVNIKSLVVKQTIIASLILERPHLELKQGENKTIEKTSATRVIFRSVAIKDGTLTWDHGLSGIPNRISRINSVLRSEGQRLLVDNADWEMGGQKFKGKSDIQLKPLTVLFSAQSGKGLTALIQTSQTPDGRAAHIKISKAADSVLMLDWTRAGSSTWTLHARLNRMNLADLPLTRSMPQTAISGVLSGGPKNGTLKLTDPAFGSAQASLWAELPNRGWKSTGVLSNLKFQSLRISTLSFTAKGHSNGNPTIQLEAKPESVNFRGIDFGNSELAIKGSENSHRINIKSTLPEGSISAEGNGRIKDGNWLMTWKQLSGEVRTSFHSAAPFKTAVSSSAWSLDNLILSDGSGSISISARKNLDLHIHINSEDFDPSPLAFWLPGLTMSRGSLTGGLRIGRKGTTTYSKGEAHLKTESLQIDPGEVSLKDVVLHLTAKGENSLSVSGRATPVQPEEPLKGLLQRLGSVLLGTAKRKKPSEAMLRLQGTLDLNGPDLHVVSKNLQFKTKAGLSGSTQLNLHLDGNWEFPRLKGLIHLEEAQFKTEPRGKSSPIQGNKNPSLPSKKEFDLKVQFDRNVWYRRPEADIETSGELLLKKDAGGPLRLFGTIRTLQGQYRAYGREFTIQEGRLTFNGDHPPDPEINIQTSYVDGKTRAKILLALNGALSSPKPTLTSEPPLEQRDIIALLVIGRPLHDLAPSEDSKQKREEAVRLFTEYLSSEFRKRVLTRVKLDTFNVRARGLSNADISAGKYVTKKVFVTYGQTLGPSAQRRVEARYAITPKLSLEGRNQSDGRHVLDLFRTFELK